jgi:hypothetical protein
MTHRIRMARKRLMVAREREISKWRAYWHGPERSPVAEDYAQWRWASAGLTLRAIERRKDRRC